MPDRPATGPSPQRLLEAALAGKGNVPLEQLLSECIDPARLRELVRKHGLSPKGFRVDAAPPRSLAQALTRDLDAEVLKEAIDELLSPWHKAAAPAAATPTAPAAPPAPQPCREEQLEIARLRGQLQSAHDAARAAQAESAQLASKLAREQQLVVSLRGDLAAAERRGAAAPSTPSTGADRDLVRELHEANAELEVAARAEDESRRRLAEQQTEIRELRERVNELEELVPRGKRKKVEPPPPPIADRFRVPYFTPEFYRCLVSRDMRDAEVAFDAVLRFATAGYGYPGLQVKQLEGVDLWSMRAGIKTRVYFRPRSDGDVDVLAVGDREEQDTLLRRLR